jgi:hypothetical protein
MRGQAGEPSSVDLEAFPLVRVGSPRGHGWTSEDVEHFFACADRAISRRARFVLLHDARGMPRLDAEHQRRFLAELAHRRVLIERFMIAYAALVHSPLERGVLTALSWSVSLAVPRRIFASEPEAQSYLLDAYARVGPRKRRSGEYRIKRDAG